MGRQPQKLQADGLARQNNPVTRSMLRKLFGDGKWRTIHDMVVTIGDRIPAAIAARAVPDREKAIDLDRQIEIGRRELVRSPIVSAVQAGVFERQIGATGRKEYRCVKPDPPAVRVGGPQRDDDDLVDGTFYGVSRPEINRLIKENPGITIDELIDRLVVDMHDDNIVDGYAHAQARHRTTKNKRGNGKKPRPTSPRARAEVEAMRKADPAAFLNAARRHVVRMAISNLISEKKVVEVRRFYPAEQPWTGR